MGLGLIWQTDYSVLVVCCECTVWWSAEYIRVLVCQIHVRGCLSFRFRVCSTGVITVLFTCRLGWQSGSHWPRGRSWWSSVLVLWCTVYSDCDPRDSDYTMCLRCSVWLGESAAEQVLIILTVTLFFGDQVRRMPAEYIFSEMSAFVCKHVMYSVHRSGISYSPGQIPDM